MAYRIIFEDVKKTIREIAILDGVPNVGDNIAITYRDRTTGELTGEIVAFEVRHRTFGYEKYMSDRPADDLIDGSMHLTTVHVLLGDQVHPILFEKVEE